MLKINNYSLEEGERSVFDSELQGRQERPGERDQNRLRAGHDYDNQPLCQVCFPEPSLNLPYDNQPLCQVCWREGELLCCDFCPGAYHPECLGITDVGALPNSWSCPHHRCCLCSRKAHAAGGLLFRCEACPKAWCAHTPPIPPPHPRTHFV